LPTEYPKYFGAGSYYIGPPNSVGPFIPAEALNRRGVWGRGGDNSQNYWRGKICFGAYHRDLVSRIVGRHGSLFQPLPDSGIDWGTTGISPDYTSMILGLSNAQSAVEIADSCVVQIFTDISGGYLSDTFDERARLNIAEELWDSLPIPGLYVAHTNYVAHDFLALKEKFDLPFDFDLPNWIDFCIKDIYKPDRVWSSNAVELQQKRILTSLVAKGLASGKA